MNKVELLAPAGNYDCLIGALKAGADAVYLGGEKFGARAFAENFTTEQLCYGIKYAHALGKKIFLTINTLVKETEFDEIYDYLFPFYKAGLDAVIVQDIGVFQYVKKYFPDMELHVSTQMTITGVYGAKLLKDMGAHRIVPARELSLNEIKDIKKETGLDIETFVHGAMCYCYSGQCLFSSYLGGRSGNRGKCAQPCRLPYEVMHQQKGKVKDASYPLSLKDMCTIEHLPKLIEAGIDSFKIEGRMKKPEYVAGVTAIYRKYIDMYYEDPENYQVDAKDLEILKALYIRSEIQDGYYFRHNGREMITMDSPGYTGSDERVLQWVRQCFLTDEPKCEISMEASFQKGEAASLTLLYRNEEVKVYGDVVAEALKSPVTRENIEKGLLALGDTFYACHSLKLSMDDNIFYSLKAIKELRRDAIAKLTALLCPDRTIESCRKDMLSEKHDKCTDEIYSLEPEQGYRLLLSSPKQVEAYLESSICVSHLMLESHLFDHDEGRALVSRIRRNKEGSHCVPKIIIALPYVLRKRDYGWLDEIFDQLSAVDGVLIRNLEAYAYLREKEYQGEWYADAGFYVWNAETAQNWKSFSGLCMPLELSEKEQRPLLTAYDGFEQIVYGYMPMMITANCIAKTANQCLQTNGKYDGTKDLYQYNLVDRMNKCLYVFTNCKHCYNVIYNPVVLSLHDKVKKGMRTAKRLNFTIESKEETGKVLDYFASLVNPSSFEEQHLPYREYTTGHEKKGAL